MPETPKTTMPADRPAGTIGRAIVRTTGVSALVLGLALQAHHAQAQSPSPKPPTSSAATVTATATTRATTPTLAHGLFTDIQLLRPAGTVQQFVLLLAAAITPSAAELAKAVSMQRAGAMVAIVPLAPFYRRLAAQDGECTYAVGAFENLSRHLQAYAQVPGYLRPMLVGSGPTAAFAYAVLAQAPAGIFAAGLSDGFCPQLALRPPLCASGALRWKAGASAGSVELLPATALPAPWAALPGNTGATGAGGDERGAVARAGAGAGAGADARAGAGAGARVGSEARAGAGASAAAAADTTCTPAQAEAFVQRVPQAQWAVALAPAVPAPPATPATRAPATPPATPTASAASTVSTAAFDAAYAKLAIPQAAPPPPPTQLADLPLIEYPVASTGARFVVLLSGDGGWAAIDKGLADAIVAQGLPVVGLDSLRYFWRARTPEGLAADLDRIIRHHAARWKRPEVILIGYSQGADVLPFALNRLPAATRASVRLTALLGLGEKASFEFHLANWIGPSGDRPIAPEARRLAAADTLCVYGEEERDSLCPKLAPAHVRPLALAGGHHFGGDYAAIAQKILAAAPR
jgi:type IV secretory pathway VirJ component